MAYGTLKSDVVQSSTAGTPPQFNDGNGTQTGTLCRAWVTYKSSSPQSIRASFNVSSVTYNGTGDITLNFVTPFSDTNYSTVGMGGSSSTVGYSVLSNYSSAQAPTTTSCRFREYSPSVPGNVDGDYVSIAIFR